MEELLAERNAKAAEVERLEGTTAGEIWKGDLEVFLEAYAAMEAEETATTEKLARQQLKAAGSRGKAPAKPRKVAAKKHAGSDSEVRGASGLGPLLTEACCRLPCALPCTNVESGRILPAPCR